MKKRNLIIAIIFAVITMIVIIIALLFNRNRSYEDYIGDTQDPTNLSNFYEYSESDGDTDATYTENKNANSLIDKILKENGYSHVEIVDEFYDYGEAAYSYTVVYDNTALYYVSVTDDGIAYMTKGDYNYWLDSHY